MKKIDLAIIIVNWNGQQFLEKCLSSIRQQSYQSFITVLIDNGSGDNSIDYVKKNFPEVKIIELKNNTGFAQGNNIGISWVVDKYKDVNKIVLLNNDTKVREDFLQKMVKTFNKYQSIYKIGAVAPKIRLWTKNNKKIIDAVGSGIKINGIGYNIGYGEYDQGQYDFNQEIFGFSGGAVLLNKNMLNDILLNKNKQKIIFKNGQVFNYWEYFANIFFAYYEDMDLNWRMRLRGWRCFTEPLAVVYHLHSATIPPFSFFKEYYLNRNRLLVMLRNFPRAFLGQGLWRLFIDYFPFLSKDKKYSVDKKNKKINIVFKYWRKIIMIGIMLKVLGSLIIHFRDIMITRKFIQNNKIGEYLTIKKWFSL